MFLGKNILHYAVVTAIGAFAMGTQAAEVKLGDNTANGLTAIILPDATEIGAQSNIYMAASLGGDLYVRNGATNWQPYVGGTIPAAIERVTLTASLPVQVVDFDISALIRAGLEVYVAYGKNHAEIFAAGHLGKIISQTPVSNPTTDPSADVACDTAAAPTGISYTQNGNNISITTNGQCIVPPKTGLCNAPAPAQATGVSMLQNINVTTFQMNGITVNIPGMPNPFESVGKALTNGKTCLINVPTNYANYIIEADVCYDLTNTIDTASLQGAGAFITVKPPITETFKGTIQNTQVTDCFKSGADSIADVLTKEVWIKQTDGSYLKVTANN